MNTVEDFIKQCQEIEIQYNTGKQSLYEAATHINPTLGDYPFEGPAHPMVCKVADLAFDIAENYRTETADTADWTALTSTLQKYISGDWEPTCWILSIMYGEYSDSRLIHSYSISVRRQNGITRIETASEDLKKSLGAVISLVHSKQTDERYLQNIAKLLPENITPLKLTNCNVSEYLV